MVQVHAALEPVVLQAIHHIFTNSIMEFYEEVSMYFNYIFIANIS